MEQAIERARQAHDEEAARLLYVALTRAEKWLIVCGSGTIKEDGESWYRQVEAAMIDSGASRIEGPTGTCLRIEHGGWPQSRSATSDKSIDRASALPDWATSPVAPHEPRQAPVSPSDLPGEKSLPGELTDRSPTDPAIRGSHIHRLLEHLPRHSRQVWPQIAEQLLPDLAAEEWGALVTEAAAVIESPALAHLFDADALAEVDVSAYMPEPRKQRLRGTIDRLVVSGNRVTIVDFKSNRVVPARALDTPIGILRQMAAYLGAIRAIYPDHEIDLVIVWTHTATLMPLPHDVVIAAMQSMPRLDVPAGGS
jgi:ATP-dependent helicase/nuclease subunit A